MFKITSQDGQARTGILTTAHGKVETPFLMPCATRGTVKFLPPQDILKMGAKAVISNALILFLKPGDEFIKEMGGLHKFINYPGTIFTDSGGFQMISPRLFVGINDKAVRFKNAETRQQHRLTPERVMQIENNIGSDVAMCLDHMPHVARGKPDIADAVRRTHLWAERCKTAHKELLENASGKRKKQLLFGIAQGGTYKDLRIKSAKFINDLDFDGHAMGGLCIGETRNAMFKAIEYQVPLLNPEKPRYLMGLGTPHDIIEAVARGADCFDSIFVTQNARHGNVFTWDGQIKLDKGPYKHDQRPIDSACKCPTCKNYTRAYIYHLMKLQEKTVNILLTQHNVWWAQNFMKELRLAIKESRFERFKKDFLARYKTKGKQVTTERLLARA